MCIHDYAFFFWLSFVVFDQVAHVVCRVSIFFHIRLFLALNTRTLAFLLYVDKQLRINGPVFTLPLIPGLRVD